MNSKQDFLVFFCALVLAGSAMLLKYDSVSAAAEKWVKAMDFCTESMVQDVKEEVAAGKSEFDQYCTNAGMSRAVDARCNDGKFEVKCRQ